MPCWPFMRQGEMATVRPEPAFSANRVEAVRTASKLGLMLAMLTYWDVRSELSDGSLVLAVLEDIVPEQLSITAVLLTRRQIPSRVRVFLDRLQNELERGDQMQSSLPAGQ